MNRTLTLLSLLSLTALAQGAAKKPAEASDEPPKGGATTTTKKGTGEPKTQPTEESGEAPAPKPADAQE